uniref:Putative TonB-like protein n=1 Tax=mine drainage metagenome TaxID=410659 RepID=E6QMQ4_9ZZZZ
MPQNDENRNSPESNGKSLAEPGQALLLAEDASEANRQGETEDSGATSSDSNGFSGFSSSRYLDYDTHELLERISEYEDERRWQRIREGIWISIILHILLFSALTWIPKYIFHEPQVIDPFDAIKQRKDLTYLDQLPDALREVQKARPKVTPLKPSETHVDKKTLDAIKELRKQAAPAPAPPQQQEQAVAPPPPPVVTPQPAAPVESSRQAPVPAKPNFAKAFQDPQAMMRQALRNSARDLSQNAGGGAITGGGLNQHPSAAGGAEILSDTQGVDFVPYMQRVIRETYRTWDPLIPEEVNPPIYKQGQVEVVFTILPNGRLAPQSMILTGRSGDVALDRAAWGAIQGADYPPLPREFHGPYLQLRFRFQYNVGQQ